MPGRTYYVLLVIRNLGYQRRYFDACYLAYPMTRNSPDFQTKGLCLPLRRALITAKESISPQRKFVYRRYLAPSPSSPSSLSISTTRLTYFASIFPRSNIRIVSSRPVSSKSPRVSKLISWNLTLLRSLSPSFSLCYSSVASYSSLRPKISLHPCLPTGLCPRIGLSNARCVFWLSEDIAYDPRPINLV